jgi:hypothetical protein
MLSSFGPALGADDGTVNEQQAADPDLLAPPELEERLRVQDQLVDLENALRHDISGFGGLWRDHEGAIFVAATSDSMEATAHVVLRESPGDTTVELVEVQWTLDELLDARARIRAGIPKLTQQGVDVVSVAVDVRANVVEIAATASPAAIEADLSREYGPMVRAIPSVGIDPAACTRGDCPNPLKGGLNVNIGGENCSSGFVSRAGSSYFLLSAGHCGVMGSAWTHGGTQYGTTQRRSYYDGSSADAAAAGIAAGQKSNLVYRGSPTTFFSVIGNDSGLAVGDVVCLSARTLTSYDCGYVDDNYIDVCYENRCFWDQSSVTHIDGAVGESGGAMFTLAGGNSIRAAGLMTAIANLGTIVYYSKIDNVQWELDLTTCKNSSCT